MANSTKLDLETTFIKLETTINKLEDETTTLQKEVSNNVQKRLEKAMEELKEKHRTGTNEVDDVDRAPTGTAYRELHRRQRELAKAVVHHFLQAHYQTWYNPLNKP